MRAALFAMLLLCVATTAAHAGVQIYVHKSTQTMRVVVDGAATYDWLVSTARPGRKTPTGTYAITGDSLHAVHYSHKYHHAPMPWSIFFLEGYAIHGTTDLAHLGTRASHGCVRLDPANAHVLFDLVEERGPDNTQIIITEE